MLQSIDSAEQRSGAIADTRAAMETLM
jgi:hypothetical protein